jgi:hypothetical protein
MKNWFNKILLVCTAVSVSIVVLYGLVYAQQVCCRTLVDICISISERINGDNTRGTVWATYPSHQRNKKWRSTPCLDDYSGGFGEASTCCETDGCDSYNLNADFNLTSLTEFYLLQNIATSLNKGSGAQGTVESPQPTTSLKALPIYLVTKSIIC